MDKTSGEWKQECLDRWRDAKAILEMRNVTVRRAEIARIRDLRGDEYADLLEAEIKRQWAAK